MLTAGLAAFPAHDSGSGRLGLRVPCVVGLACCPAHDLRPQVGPLHDAEPGGGVNLRQEPHPTHRGSTYVGFTLGITVLASASETSARRTAASRARSAFAPLIRAPGPVGAANHQPKTCQGSAEARVSGSQVSAEALNTQGGAVRVHLRCYGLASPDPLHILGLF